jgi:hypothetical protein
MPIFYEEMRATVDQQDLFGLFELDEKGMVLYSRVEYEKPKSVPDKGLNGSNFLTVVEAFDGGNQIAEKITFFTTSSMVADSFRATLKGESGVLPVKILLARIRDRSSAGRTKSVMVHIKPIPK